MVMINVKNLNGTSDNSPPKGYTSWKSYWEAKARRSFKNCACEGCKNPAEDGAHVQKDQKDDKKWYIVPLCKKCNKGKESTFKVDEEALIPVKT